MTEAIENHIAQDASEAAAPPREFLDRDLSWLQFTAACSRRPSDDRTPLLERVTFLGIVTSNLDEFS